MPDVTERIGSLQASLAKLRQDVPAIEWRTGQILAALAELLEIVREQQVSSRGRPEPAEAPQEGGKDRRSDSVEHHLWLACRSVPKGVTRAARDTEIRRIMVAWGASEAELAKRGFGEAR